MENTTFTTNSPDVYEAFSAEWAEMQALFASEREMLEEMTPEEEAEWDLVEVDWGVEEIEF